MNLTINVEKVVLIFLLDASSSCEMSKLLTKAREFTHLIPPHYIPMWLLSNGLIKAPANIEYCRYSGTNSLHISKETWTGNACFAAFFFAMLNFCLQNNDYSNTCKLALKKKRTIGTVLKHMQLAENGL